MNIKYIIKPWKWNNIFISFGENCLTDDILRRYRLKSFTTPYSHGRTNIEYILEAEKAKFTSLLDTSFMDVADCDNKKVVRLNIYNHCINQYSLSSMNGIEFTHHDVKNNEEVRNTFQRRIGRLLERHSKNLFLFYYHRYCIDTNEKMLLGHLDELRQIYSNRNRGKVNVVAFTQRIVTSETERRLEYKIDKTNGICLYEFYTLNIWEGADEDIFWARCDEDLVRQMIKSIAYEFKLPGRRIL